MTCLNFASTGLRILLHPLSSSRREKPSRKIALNSNGEVNYRELAQRPCIICGIQVELPKYKHGLVSKFTFEVISWKLFYENNSCLLLVIGKQCIVIRYINKWTLFKTLFSHSTIIVRLFRGHFLWDTQ